MLHFNLLSPYALSSIFKHSGCHIVCSPLLLVFILAVIYVGECFDLDDEWDDEDLINRVLNPPVKMYIHPTAFSDPKAYQETFHKKDVRPDGNDISKYSSFFH